MRALAITVVLFAAAYARAFSVTIISPTNGSAFGTGAFTIEAVATDSQRGIFGVEFYLNDVVVGFDSNPPYSVFIDDLPPDHYAILARAYDNFFVVADSPRVHVRVGNPPVQLVRGPYLQSASATNMVVRWRTDWFVNSVVRWGTNAAALNFAATNATANVDHEINVTGLQANTVYFYSVGSSTQSLAGGSSYYFRTAPTNARPVRMWIIGDAGTSNPAQEFVRDAYYDVTGGAETDLFLMLGDNAYDLGFDAEHQTAVFDMYGDVLRHTPVWPTIGNHDAGEHSDEFGNQARDYFEIFTLPKNGESGGLASGTENYYSFDYANIHVVCLDSFLSDNSPGSAMMTWLANDLAATDKDWIIAFWHHPPYSKGTHDSDSDELLASMREHVLPILEDYGVDLVLGGHSHNYERSMLLDGHYGPSWTLTPSMVLDASRGRRDEDGPYQKPAGGIGSHSGCVYVVCGCSGQGGLAEGYPLHPAMALNHGGFGSMILHVNGLQLDAQFLRPTGEIDDYFTIDKSANVTNRPSMAILRGTNGALISWPTSKPGFALQSAPAVPATNWQAVPGPVTTNGRRSVVTIPLADDKQFFRLERQP